MTSPLLDRLFSMNTFDLSLPPQAVLSLPSEDPSGLMFNSMFGESSSYAADLDVNTQGTEPNGFDFNKYDFSSLDAFGFNETPDNSPEPLDANAAFLDSFPVPEDSAFVQHPSAHDVGLDGFTDNDASFVPSPDHVPTVDDILSTGPSLAEFIQQLTAGDNLLLDSSPFASPPTHVSDDRLSLLIEDAGTDYRLSQDFSGHWGNPATAHHSESQASDAALENPFEDDCTVAPTPSTTAGLDLSFDSPPLSASPAQSLASWQALLEGPTTFALTEEANVFGGAYASCNPVSEPFQSSGDFADTFEQSATALTQSPFHLELAAGFDQYIDAQQPSSSFSLDDPLPFPDGVEVSPTPSTASIGQAPVDSNAWPFDSVAYRRDQDLLSEDLGGAIEATQVPQQTTTSPSPPSGPSGSQRNNGEGKGRTPSIAQQEPQQKNSTGKRKRTPDENSANLDVSQDSSAGPSPPKRQRSNSVDHDSPIYGVFCPHPAKSDSSKRCDEWLPGGAATLENHIERVHGLPLVLGDGRLRCPLFKSLGSSAICDEKLLPKSVRRHVQCRAHELESSRVGQEYEPTGQRIANPRIACPYCGLNFEGGRRDSVRRHLNESKSCTEKPANWESKWKDLMNRLPRHT